MKYTVWLGDESGYDNRKAPDGDLIGLEAAKIICARERLKGEAAQIWGYPLDAEGKPSSGKRIL